MSKGIWAAGAAGLLLGFALGVGATYAWLRAKPAPSPGPAQPPGLNAEEQAAPDPSLAEVQQAFEGLLSRSKVDAEVTKFTRTDWSNHVQKPTQSHPYFESRWGRIYWVTYDVELKFRQPSQLKEDLSLMWSPNHKLQAGAGSMMFGAAIKSVNTGDTLSGRGVIPLFLVDGKWTNNEKLDVGH